MKRPILITQQDGQEIVINEDQICTITPLEPNLAVIRMSNGDEIICREPTYNNWKNDVYIRPS